MKPASAIAWRLDATTCRRRSHEPRGARLVGCGGEAVVSCLRAADGWALVNVQNRVYNGTMRALQLFLRVRPRRLPAVEPEPRHVGGAEDALGERLQRLDAGLAQRGAEQRLGARAHGRRGGGRWRHARGGVWREGREGGGGARAEASASPNTS